METGTHQFTIQRASEAFTCIELAMENWTNDLNSEHCFKVLESMKEIQTSFGPLRGLGLSSPSRNISIKINLYNVAVTLTCFLLLIKGIFFPTFIFMVLLYSYGIK